MGHLDKNTSPPTIDPYTDQAINYTLSSSLHTGSNTKRVGHLSGIEKEFLENDAENLNDDISSTQTHCLKTSFRSDVLKIINFN